jgi:hypothetical protein
MIDVPFDLALSSVWVPTRIPLPATVVTQFVTQGRSPWAADAMRAKYTDCVSRGR